MELAALIPVVVVVALSSFNLARYVALCATFDRVALDAIVSQGVSPAGAQTAMAAVGEVRKCIEDALGDVRSCEVEVSAEPLGETDRGRKLFVSPLLTSFRCTLVYRPWPSTFVIGGVVYESPVTLRHERSLVVDRYRPGVVI